MKIKSISNAVIWNFKKFFSAVRNLDELFWKPKEEINLDSFFRNYQHNSDFYFVQIGANDGMSGDTLREFVVKYRWKGILVEPVPYVFSRLLHNYKGYSGLNFENSAISTENGFKKFYALAEHDLQSNKLFEDNRQYKIDQLGSFDKSTLLKHSYMHPDFEDLIEELNVPTITFDALLKKYNVTRIDLLQLDVEGYDYEILNTINFDRIIPKVLVFEHQHMKKAEYKFLLRKFRKIRYKFYSGKLDTIGILQN